MRNLTRKTEEQMTPSFVSWQNGLNISCPLGACLIVACIGMVCAQKLIKESSVLYVHRYFTYNQDYFLSLTRDAASV